MVILCNDIFNYCYLFIIDPENVYNYPVKCFQCKEDYEKKQSDSKFDIEPSKIWSEYVDGNFRNE